jgi:hypothetical protein
MKKAKLLTSEAPDHGSRQGERLLFRFLAGRERRQVLFVNCSRTFFFGCETASPCTKTYMRRRGNYDISIGFHWIRVAHDYLQTNQGILA